MSSLGEFDHLKIQLTDVKAATNNFASDKLIGMGGFGPVYKGELFLSQGPTMVAFKRLDRKFGQGNIEFWKEIMMLSKYRHENLVTLMHFCIEGEERILVYEYASRGSLDRYLNKSFLTWTQRLKICVGIAHALHYLHDPNGGQQRVLHRDIKSSNVLVDDNWTAKVSDFGLAKIGPANQLQTYLFSNAVGTPGYCDPLYLETGFLSKESDVYSFGVVLFELLCGKPCFEYGADKRTQIYVSMWRRYYEEGKLHEVIFDDLKEQMEPGSLHTFSAIAYRCVKRGREERPKMDEIVRKLELALHQQEVFEYLQKKVDFEEMSRIAKLAHVFVEFKSQLLILFMNGILIVDEKTLISINNNGDFIELVSATRCISGEELVCEPYENSRFSHALWGWPYRPFEVEVSTHFLSPNVRYTVNLVFKHCGIDQTIQITFRYKINNETQYLTSSIALPGEDGWLMTELFQFTSNNRQHNFRIEFLESVEIYSTCNLIFLQGIEFRPIEVIS